MFKSLLLVVSVLSLAACDVNPSKVSGSDAKEFVSKVTYVKDQRTGLCYAVVGTRKTMDSSQNGISWTWVPCEKVEKYLDE